MPFLVALIVFFQAPCQERECMCFSMWLVFGLLRVFVQVFAGRARGLKLF